MSNRLRFINPRRASAGCGTGVPPVNDAQAGRATFPARKAAVTAAFIIGFVLSVSLTVWAQGGSIKGKVVADIPDQRKPLSGVLVSLSSERLGGKNLQSISDPEGRYDFVGLIAGDYLVT